MVINFFFSFFPFEKNKIIFKGMDNPRRVYLQIMINEWMNFLEPSRGVCAMLCVYCAYYLLYGSVRFRGSSIYDIGGVLALIEIYPAKIT